MTRDPGIRQRKKERRRDSDKTHAYCEVCSRRVYAGETGCEAGHRLKPGWEADFVIRAGVGPEKRPGGLLPELAPPPHPYDQWLDELAAEFEDRSFVVTGRNVEMAFGGVAVEAQLWVWQPNFDFWVSLFASADLARKAEGELRRMRNVERAIANGFTSTLTENRAMFSANAHPKRLDPSRFADAVSVVTGAGLPEQLPVPAAEPEPSAPPPAAEPEPSAPPPAAEPEPSAPPTAAAPEPLASPPMAETPTPATKPGSPSTPQPNVIDQLRRLGELHASGVLTDAEFESKKAELLGRL